jgi:hypothetical protein
MSVVASALAGSAAAWTTADASALALMLALSLAPVAELAAADAEAGALAAGCAAGSAALVCPRHAHTPPPNRASSRPATAALSAKRRGDSARRPTKGMALAPLTRPASTRSKASPRCAGKAAVIR